MVATPFFTLIPHTHHLTLTCTRVYHHPLVVPDETGLVLDTAVKINCLRKIKEERKRSNTRIYVVRQYAYIHRRRQGESFAKKIGRLQ